MKLVWSAFALADRDGIFTHIEAHNPRAASAVDARSPTAARRLVHFPDCGGPGRVAGTRELVITGTPYVAAYAVTAETIRILRVLHGAQRWPDELPQG